MKFLLGGATSEQLELLKLNSPYFTLHLRGGIGNQLFQYSAGLHFALTHGVSVRFNDVGIDHGVSIRSLGLPGVFVGNEMSQRIRGNLFKILNSRSKGDLVDVKQIGFDQDLTRIIPFTHIRGYFQTSYYYQELSKRGIRIVINEKHIANPIREFEQLMPPNSTIIHIRQGDYLNGSSTLGNLTQNYFRETVHEFSNSAHNFILTDTNHKDISEFLSSWDMPFTIVPRFSKVFDFDYLHLFTRASTIIGSNSSFSWWGAQFAKADANVYLPEPWFKSDQLNSQMGKNFYAKNWKLVPSNWN